MIIAFLTIESCSHAIFLTAQLSAEVPVDQVVLIAEKAGKAILDIYNGEVRLLIKLLPT